jgi:hypothetical protein
LPAIRPGQARSVDELLTSVNSITHHSDSSRYFAS